MLFNFTKCLYILNTRDVRSEVEYWSWTWVWFNWKLEFVSISIRSYWFKAWGIWGKTMNFDLKNHQYSIGYSCCVWEIVFTTRVTHMLFLLSCFLQNYYQNKLRLALIGQSLFGQEVYTNLRKQGHRVVGVFTVPDRDGKADPLGKYWHTGDDWRGSLSLLSIISFSSSCPLFWRGTQVIMTQWMNIAAKHLWKWYAYILTRAWPPLYIVTICMGSVMIQSVLSQTPTV